MTPRDDDRECRISRREFVRAGSLIAAGAALSLGAPPAVRSAEDASKKDETPPIPRKVLGRTGAEVSIIGLGTALLGQQNKNNPELPVLVDVFSEAIDRGVSYIDTARIYGRAEEALNAVLKTRRDKVFLATKLWANTREEAQRSFEESLRKLGVDHVDVLHLHSTGDKDIDKVLGKGGAWELLEEMKKAGKARFLGITGHSRPANFVRMLETDRVDVMMVAMNFVDRHIYGFEEKVLPTAVKHKTGVMAMKVYGGVKGSFPNYEAKTPHPSQMPGEYHARAVAYARSLEGVTGLVIGAHSRAQLLENIRRVVEAKPLSKPDFEKLCDEGKTLAAEWTPRFGPVV